VFKHGWPAGTTDEQKRVSTKETIRQLRESGEIDIIEEGSWEEDMVAHCKTKLAIKPRAGRAVLFYSQHPNGKEDKMAFHGGCPV